MCLFANCHNIFLLLSETQKKVDLKTFYHSLLESWQRKMCHTILGDDMILKLRVCILFHILDSITTRCLLLLAYWVIKYGDMNSIRRNLWICLFKHGIFVVRWKCVSQLFRKKKKMSSHWKMYVELRQCPLLITHY